MSWSTSVVAQFSYRISLLVVMNTEDCVEFWVHVATFASPEGICSLERLSKPILSSLQRASTKNGPLQRSWYLRHQLLIWDEEHLPKAIKELPVGALPPLGKHEAKKDWKFAYRQAFEAELLRSMRTPTSKVSPSFASPTSTGARQQFIAAPDGVRRTFVGEGKNREVIENINTSPAGRLETFPACDPDFEDDEAEAEVGVEYNGDVHDTRFGARRTPSMPSSPNVRDKDFKLESRKQYKVSGRPKPKDKTMKGGSNYWKEYDRLADYEEQ